MKNQTPQKKTPYLLYGCLGIFLLLQVICIVGIAFYIPTFYKDTKYSYFITQAGINFAQGNYQGAIAEYTKAIETKPDDAFAYLYRATTYAQLSDYIHAKPDFEKAIQIDPLNTSALNNYCWFGSLLGDAENVLTICEKAVELEPENPYFRDSRGLAYALTGNYDAAIQDFLYYVSVSAEYSFYPADVADRVRWIESLSQDINPFTVEELKRLLEDDYEEEFLPQQDV